MDSSLGGQQVEKFIRDTGPQREEEMGFCQEAIGSFEPFLSPLGFQRVSADPYGVTFASDKVIVALSHGFFDFHIDAHIGPKPDKYTLFEISEVLHIPGLPDPRAHNREEVHERLCQLVDLMREHLMSLLMGDEEVLKQLHEDITRLRLEYTRRMMGGD